MATRTPPRPADLYEEDFAAWVQTQADALRALAASGAAPPGLDLPRLIEEVGELGTSERRAIESHIIIAIAYLLKLEYSPASEPRRGWADTVRNERVMVDWRLSATLTNHLHDVWDDLYPAARDLAADGLQQDGVAAEVLPESCPYSFE